MAAARGCIFRVGHGRVEATKAGPERDPDRLVAAVRAVVPFAHGEERARGPARSP